MKVIEYRFNEYYHGLLTIEADDLTESLKESVSVKERDCYALCTSYCGESGEILFAVLAIGPTWENCSKGLKKKQMLGIWSMDEVCEKTARIVEPDFTMMEKRDRFLDSLVEQEDDDIEFLRTDYKLDDLRNPFYPDIVTAVIPSQDGFAQCDVALTGVDGPFLKGVLCEEVDEHELYDEVKALPFFHGEDMYLMGLFIGEDLPEDAQKMLQKIEQLSEDYGVSYRGEILRS